MKQVITTLLFSFFCFFAFAQDVNPKISIQGTLKDANGAAVENGQYDMTFKLFNSSTGGSAKWEEDQSGVPVVGGVYTALLGSVTDLDPGIFNEPLFLEAVVNGTPLSPRLELSYAPYSLAVNTAVNATNLTGCSGKLGDIKYSILAPTDFATENGDCWVLMDGGSLTSDTPLSDKYGFNVVPDARGLFLRSHDTRTSGRLDPNRTATTAIGTYQGDSNKSHTHTMQSAGGHSHSYTDSRFGYSGSGGHFAPNEGSEGNHTDSRTTGSSGAHTHTINSNGGSESRPKNMNFYLYIRVK